MTSLKATILIVEDDASVARLQCRRLESAGLDVVHATTPAEALALAQARTFDLAVLDYLLEGGATGLDLFVQFKAAGLALPAIIVTACGEEETVIQALRAGVSDFVTKTAAYLDYLPEAIARVLKQVRTEKRLAESEAQFASFMDNTPAVATIKDDELRLVFVNALGQRLFHLHDYQGKTAFDVLPPDAAQRVRDDELKVLSTGQTTERIHVAPLPDGTLRHWLTYRFPIYDISGRRLLGGVSLDISERVRAEQALRNSEARFRSLSESATDAIVVIDQFGHVVSWNSAAGRMFGYTSEEMSGRSLEHIMPPRYREAFRASLARMLAYGEDAFHDRPREFEGLRRDGSEFPVELSLGMWNDADGSYFTGIVRDVTERRRAEEELRRREEQLRHSQRLEALGTLAGGVAHEFNNLLQSVQGYTRCAMDGLDPTERRYQDLEVVLKAAARAATLTRQLLGFSRQQALQYCDLDANQMVRDSVRILRPLIGRHIRLELALAENIPPVHTDPAHFQQLLTNLCVNARDAMPAGGHLLIKTETTRLDESACAGCADLVPGEYLALTVSDTGCGMSDDVLRQAFDPFFTTKEIGKGTGLGLATVYGVVKQHKGAIRVHSEVDVGTSICILLPTVASADPNQASPVGPKDTGATARALQDEPAASVAGHSPLTCLPIEP
jgi:PAS domain S-box-containing protein